MSVGERRYSNRRAISEGLSMVACYIGNPEGSEGGNQRRYIAVKNKK